MCKYRIIQNGITRIYIKICENCGIDLDRSNNISAKYCKKCSEEIKKEKTKERVRRYREQQKDNKK